MMPNSLEEMNLKSESTESSNSLVANLNELSSMNDFNNDFKNKPVIRSGNKTSFFFPNSVTQIPFFPNHHQNHSYQFFNPYQMSAKNFYSFNMFNKPPYQDKRNYLRAKKDQNMHKLWPHSVQKNPQPSDTTNEVCAKPEASGESQKEKVQVNETEETTSLSTNTKTPMCQIHELVKFNKIKHEYILLDEKGPAHKKTFYVELKLGGDTSDQESYQAIGSSIKKAQHKAAEIALNETKFDKPTPRVKSDAGLKKMAMQTAKKDPKSRNQQSNTVKLNSLCMKHALKANYEQITAPAYNSIYNSFDAADIKPFVYQPPQVFSQSMGFNRAFGFARNSSRAHRYNKFGADVPYKIKLKLANEEFVAEGETVQKAKHKAATLALDFLSNEENFKKVKDDFTKSVQTENNGPQDKGEAGLVIELNKSHEPNVKILAMGKSDSENPEKFDTIWQTLTRQKSEISILLEFCLRFKKSISFELVNESGPSHIKKFITKCSITSSSTPNDEYFEVFGEGNSKKQSKQKSALEMLKVLHQKCPHSLESLYFKTDTTKKADSKQLGAEKKKRKSKSNIIVAKKTSPDYGSGSINPITRLIQIQQAKKEPEPVFELVSSVNTGKKNDVTKSRSEFCISVSIKLSNDELIKCEAKGPNKKAAKQNAAEAMLVRLGYQPQQAQIKPALKQSDENGEKSDKKVKFADPRDQDDQEQKSVIKIKSALPTNKIKLYKDQLSDRPTEVNVLLDKNEFEVCSTISKELLESIEKMDKGFYSQTAENYLKQKDQSSSVISASDFNETEAEKAKLKILTNGSEGNYKAALDYLANIFNFKCNYQSILGRDKSINSYLSLSILSNTDKPFSGQGATRVQSSNLAAAAALKYLANYNQKN